MNAGRESSGGKGVNSLSTQVAKISSDRMLERLEAP
jgi:hypothetical protein